jgi:hypothetical protein
LEKRNFPCWLKVSLRKSWYFSEKYLFPEAIDEIYFEPYSFPHDFCIGIRLKWYQWRKKKIKNSYSEVKNSTNQTFGNHTRELILFSTLPPREEISLFIQLSNLSNSVIRINPNLLQRLLLSFQWKSILQECFRI